MNYKVQLRYFLMVATAFILSTAHAQDLIVTYEGDSLNCKITKIKDNFVYFIFTYDNSHRKTLLPLDKITYYQYNYYYQPELSPDILRKHASFSRFKIALSGGWSYRLGKVSDMVPMDYQSYVKKLKMGYHYGGDITFYVSKQWGFGIKSTNFRAKNELLNVPYTSMDGTVVYGVMRDDISIYLIAPYVSSRVFDSYNRHSLMFNFGIGYVGYDNKAVLLSDIRIKGSTLGLLWDVGYDIGLTKNIALGFQFSFIAATLTSCDITSGGYTQHVTLSKGTYENLSRIDVSVGVRVNL